MLNYPIIFLFILAVSACEKDKTPPGEITNLVAIGEVEQVTMSWTEPTDADLVSIQIVEIGADKVYALPSGLNGVTITGLTNGTSYEFEVVAVDANGNKSNAVTTTATPRTAFLVAEPYQNEYEPSVYVNYSDGYQTIAPSATFGVDTLGKIHITVSFNRPLDVSTVLSEQTIYFEGTGVSPGDLSFSEDNTSLTFTSTELFSSFGTSVPSASYTAYIFEFVLVGENVGGGAILDSNGMALDGDEDGQPGGNFVLELYVYEGLN